MNEVKSKLQSGHDREEIAFVENLFEQKNFHDATKVSFQILVVIVVDLYDLSPTGDRGA